MKQRFPSPFRLLIKDPESKIQTTQIQAVPLTNLITGDKYVS
jgi:hypothetical protein